MIEPPVEPYIPDPLRGWRILPSVLTFGAFVIWRDKRNERIKREARALPVRRR